MYIPDPGPDNFANSFRDVIQRLNDGLNALNADIRGSYQFNRATRITRLTKWRDEVFKPQSEVVWQAPVMADAIQFAQDLKEDAEAQIFIDIDL